MGFFDIVDDFGGPDPGQGAVGGFVALDAQPVQFVLHHGRHHGFESGVVQQVIEIVLVVELQPVMDEYGFYHLLGEKAELDEGTGGIGEGVMLRKPSQVSQLGTARPEKLEVKRSHSVA